MNGNTNLNFKKEEERVGEIYYLAQMVVWFYNLGGL